jgi:hypothetical protein
MEYEWNSSEHEYGEKLEQIKHKVHKRFFSPKFDFLQESYIFVGELQRAGSLSTVILIKQS